MVYCLIAEGPNDVKIPCLFWTNYEAAEKECINLLGEPTYSDEMKWSVCSEGSLPALNKDDESIEDDGEFYLSIYPKDTFNFYPKRPSRRLNQTDWNQFRHLVSEWKKWSNSLKKKLVNSRNIFTSYYGGCGSVSAFQLKEIQEGIPSVPFNLD